MAGLPHLEVLYGKMEGTDGRFTRDPTGLLAIDAGIFHRRGLGVTYRYLQGTEERYQEISSGKANISLVVGRTALKHFLDSGTARVIGCSMNSCPYRLVVQAGIQSVTDLREKSLACRENIARSSPLAQAFQQTGQLKLEKELRLELFPTDKDALDALLKGAVQGALLTQVHAIAAEEKGFRRIHDWPDVVDDPLPLVMETTEKQCREKKREFGAFLAAYREGIAYLTNHRDEAIRMLQASFGQSPWMAAKAYNDCRAWLNDSLRVDMKQLEKLLAGVAPQAPGAVQTLASKWIVSDL